MERLANGKIAILGEFTDLPSAKNYIDINWFWNWDGARLWSAGDTTNPIYLIVQWTTERGRS